MKLPGYLCLILLFCLGCDVKDSGSSADTDTPSRENDDESSTGTVPDSHTNIDTDSNTDSDSEMYTNGDGDLDTDSMVDASVDSVVETDTGTDSVVDTDTGIEEDARFALVGYGAVDAMGQNGTTGGEGDSTPDTVTSGAELQTAIDGKGDGEPLIVHVSGRITHSEGRVVIKDVKNISILGLGDNAEFDGFGLFLRRTSNVIIRNLKIHHVDSGDKDAIQITDDCHHIWVDHCEFYSDLTHGKDHYDGALDITHASDYITVSWNYFHDHFKVSLIGHSENNASEDEGHFLITYHHNYFKNLSSRLPSVRFGKVHIFNNYYEGITNEGDLAGTAISSRMGACVRVEKNVFENVTRPIMTDQSKESGSVELVDNDFGASSKVDESPTCTLPPPYEYLHILDDNPALKNSVIQKAGVGKISQ